MAILVGKGNLLKQSIASVYTTIAQMKTIDISGSKTLTFDSTVLEGGVAKTKGRTGYADPATLKGEFFYDPALSGHHAFSTLIENAVDTNFKVAYSDGASSQIFLGVGFGLDVKIQEDDGVTGTLSIETSGSAAWP